MTKFKEYCFINLLSLLLFLPLITSGLTLKRSNSWVACKFNNDRTPRFTNLQVRSSEQLSNAFPEVLNGLKKTKVILNRNSSNAIAIYGNHHYKISITDDLSNNYSTIDSFNKQYNEVADDKSISSVRDGYKTITTTHPESGITSMSFVFSRRYLFKVTAYHKQTSYMVWRFIELNKFKDLK